MPKIEDYAVLGDLHGGSGEHCGVDRLAVPASFRFARRIRRARAQPRGGTLDAFARGGEHLHGPPVRR
jgi:hypothetical protein